MKVIEKWLLAMIFTIVAISLLWQAPSASANTAKPTLPEIGKVQSEKAITSAAFSPDGKYFVTGAIDGKISFWNVGSLKHINSWETGQYNIQEIIFSADGTRLFILAESALLIMDTATGSSLKAIDNQVKDIALSDDGLTLLYIKQNDLIYWDIDQQKISNNFTLATAPHSLAISDTLGHIAIALENGDITIREIQSGNYIHTIKSSINHDPRYTKHMIQYSNDSSALYSAIVNPKADGYSFSITAPTFKVFDTTTKYSSKQLPTNFLNSFPIRLDQFIISPDDSYLIGIGLSNVEGYGDYLIVYDLTSGQLVQSTFTSTKDNPALAINATSNLLFASTFLYDTSSLPSTKPIALNIISEKQTMLENEMQSISAQLQYIDGKTENVDFSKVQWKSSNEKVAKFTFGKLEALGTGESTISASYNGLSTLFVIKVSTFNALEPAHEVDVDKIWTIKFNKKVDISTIKEQNIYIVDANDQIIPLLYYVEAGQESSVQLIPVKNYTPGEKYTLWVRDLVDTTGKPLNGLTKKEFYIKK